MAEKKRNKGRYAALHGVTLRNRPKNRHAGTPAMARLRTMSSTVSGSTVSSSMVRMKLPSIPCRETAS
jgi:hypothetical protein